VPRYRFGEFVLSPRRRVLLRGGREQPLIPRYFDLLVFLVERRNDAVHRREIFDSVWSDVVVSDSALSQAIRTIRRVLEDDPREPRFVRTVSRHGYQFVCADVVEEDDGAPGMEGGPVPALSAIDASPDREHEIGRLLRLVARIRGDRSVEDDQREAAERLHQFGTSDALRRLEAEGDSPFARALLRDTRWDVAGAGPVPIAGQPHPGRVVAHLVRLRLSRAAGLVAARWAGASLGVAVAGAVGGAAGGILLVAVPGSTSPPPAIVVLSLVGAGLGAVTGAGVGAGLATAEAIFRSRRVLALGVGGATGGAVVGLALQFLTRWTLRVLFGIDLQPGGGLEGLVIGAAAGLGYALSTSSMTGGLAAPRGRARARVAVMTAVFSAAAALVISLSGRPLAGGTVNAVAQAAKGAQIALAPLGALIGEPGFGRLTAALIAVGEGAFFGAGLALGLTHRGRISSRSHGPLTSR
jgi:DNA-binding winged helix-turn-helix (wHTH) protein